MTVATEIIPHKDIRNKYETRNLVSTSDPDRHVWAQCPKKHDGLILNVRSTPPLTLESLIDGTYLASTNGDGNGHWAWSDQKVFLHGDILEDNKFRASNVSAQRNEYVRNLAEHLGVRVPEDEVFTMTDFPYLALPLPRTINCSSRGAGPDSDDDDDEWYSRALHTQGNIPNPRLTNRFADEPSTMQCPRDRFSISDTVNMGTGIIAAGGAVISATAAVQGMNHLRAQTRSAPNPDPELGEPQEVIPETMGNLSSVETSEANGAATETNPTFNRSVGTVQLPAVSIIPTIPKPTIGVDQADLETGKATKDPIPSVAEAQIEEPSVLPFASPPDPRSTIGAQPIHDVTTDLAVTPKPPLHSTINAASLNCPQKSIHAQTALDDDIKTASDVHNPVHIHLPSPPSTDPDSTIAARTLPSPPSNSVESVDDVAFHQVHAKRQRLQ